MGGYVMVKDRKKNKKNNYSKSRNYLSSNLYKKGNYFFPKDLLPEKFLEKIKNFHIRDDDIWIVTYPKSGTTWISYIVWLLLHDGNDDDKDISEKVVFLEWPSPSLPEIENWPSRRVIKTHIPLELLPENLLDGSSGAKVIYVARNPYDVCKSYYQFIKSLTFVDYKGDLMEFTYDFLEGNLPYSPYSLHIKDAIKRKEEKHILFIKFNELSEYSKIDEISQFLNVKNDSQLIKRVKYLTNFNIMAKNKNVNYEWLQENGLMIENSKFMNNRSQEIIFKDISQIIKNNLDINILRIFTK